VEDQVTSKFGGLATAASERRNTDEIMAKSVQSLENLMASRYDLVISGGQPAQSSTFSQN
jgi:hypothetical protein